MGTTGLPVSPTVKVLAAGAPGAATGSGAGGMAGGAPGVAGPLLAMSWATWSSGLGAGCGLVSTTGLASGAGAGFVSATAGVCGAGAVSTGFWAGTTGTGRGGDSGSLLTGAGSVRVTGAALSATSLDLEKTWVHRYQTRPTTATTSPRQMSAGTSGMRGRGAERRPRVGAQSQASSGRSLTSGTSRRGVSSSW